MVNVRKLCGWIMTLVLLIPVSAMATYSIVGTDTKFRQVGGAGTSCVGSLDVYIIYGGAPGHGAAHAQAAANTQGRDRAALRLKQDVAPKAIIDEITSSNFDPSARSRQYGIADLSGRAAGFSGSGNGNFSDDLQGTFETYTYSVQGNILTSRAVIEQAERGFKGDGCDLADRLMDALEAGAENGEGDNRCTPRGIPSDSAFIHVDLADGTEYLHISVTNTAPRSPLIELRQKFDKWRADNECPEDDDDDDDDDDNNDDDNNNNDDDNDNNDDNNDNDDDDNDNNDNNNDDDNNNDNDNDNDDDDDDNNNDDSDDDDDSDTDSDSGDDDDNDDDDNDNGGNSETGSDGSCGCAVIGARTPSALVYGLLATL